MNRFAELLASTAARPTLIVHLGAGTCKEYELYKSLGTSKVILVEPDQRLAGQASDKFGNQPNVKIIDLAIATENGTQFLNISSNPRFNSLLTPAGLLDFYPNIEITDSVEVETITLEHLCIDEDIDGNTDNLLVAELQGLEKEVFSSVSKRTLNKFKWIVISTSEQNLYQSVSNETQSDLVQVMQKAGYTVLCFMENTPPFATSVLCLRNEAIAKNISLKQRIADRDNSLTKLKQQLSEQKSCSVKQENTYGVKIASLEESLLSKTNALQLKSDELETTLAKLKSVSGDLKAKTNELNAKSDALAAKSDALAAKSDELTAKSDAFTAKSKELEDALNKIQSINTERERLSRKIEKDAKELTEMQQTLRINNKLMLKYEADLSDLQNQHRTALQHQEKQHILLCELKEKLGQASEFYRKLNLQNLVLDGDKLDQNDSEEMESIGSDNTQGQSTR